MDANGKRSTRLRRLRVTELSLVPEPANAAARVVLRKQRATPPGGAGLVALAKARASAAAFKPCSDCPSRPTCRSARACAIETPARLAVRKTGGAGLVEAARRRAAELTRQRGGGGR